MHTPNPIMRKLIRQIQIEADSHDNWPIIIKCQDYKSQKSKKLFQTEGDYRDMTTNTTCNSELNPFPIKGSSETNEQN